jgi:hypothetical protein
LKRYIIEIEHNNFKWRVSKDLKEFKKIHKILKKVVKRELGINCSTISKQMIQKDWAVKDFKFFKNDIL